VTNNRRRFFRIRLDTQRGRRWAAAIGFLFPIFYFLITFGDKPSISSFGQVLIVGGILGGFSYQRDTPVKPFEGGLIKRPGTSFLNDEYDLARRDNAHYTAYKFWRIVIIVASTVFFVFHDLIAGEHFVHWHLRLMEQQILEALIVPAAMAFLILPQAILLWTEGDIAPEDALGPDTSALSSIS
jgi:hypothetical protein